MTEHGWQRQRESYVYEFLYRLTGREEYNPGLPDETVFRTVEELKEYIRGKKGENYEDMYSVMAYLLTGEHQMKPALYGWFKSKGITLEGFNDTIQA